jgi:Protein of unknown function (DUF3489)
MLQSKTRKKAKPARTKGGAGKPKKAVQSRSRPASSKTKQEVVVALLRQPTGTTVAAMMKATGWQPHSVRGFLAGVVRKKLGLSLVSETTETGRVYRIAERTAVSTRAAMKDKAA